jgi:hypothetical protein
VRGERGKSADFNRDARDMQAGEAALRDPCFVVAGRQAEKAEVALSVGAGLVDVIGVGAGEVDFCVGEGHATGTGDHAADDALRGGLGPERYNEER